MFPYELEHVCSYTVTLAQPPELIGPVAEGLRLNAYVSGGEVTGPRIQGRLLPVGGDWLTVRTDGVAVLDVRASFETHDGALIYLSYNGVGDLGETGYADFVSGKPPKVLALRAAPRMQTSHPEYAWVNRLQFVNVGEVDFEAFEVAYDVYALR
jgi:hypothetical protein